MKWATCFTKPLRHIHFMIVCERKVTESWRFCKSLWHRCDRDTIKKSLWRKVINVRQEHCKNAQKTRTHLQGNLLPQRCKNANLLLCGALIAKDLREKCRLLKKMHPHFWPVDTFYLIIICILLQATRSGDSFLCKTYFLCCSYALSLPHNPNLTCCV